MVECVDALGRLVLFHSVRGRVPCSFPFFQYQGGEWVWLMCLCHYRSVGNTQEGWGVLPLRSLLSLLFHPIGSSQGSYNHHPVAPVVQAQAQSGAVQCKVAQRSAERRSTAQCNRCRRSAGTVHGRSAWVQHKHSAGRGKHKCVA